MLTVSLAVPLWSLRLHFTTHTCALTMKSNNYTKEPQCQVLLMEHAVIITHIQEPIMSTLSGLPFPSDSLKSSQCCVCLFLSYNRYRTPCFQTPYPHACSFTCLDLFILCSLSIFCDWYRVCYSPSWLWTLVSSASIFQVLKLQICTTTSKLICLDVILNTISH